MTTALSKAEASDLRACEQVISKGINTFRDVGKALAKIREDKLYKGEYKSFEKYCDTRWGFGRSYANRLIEASDVPEVVPNGTKIETEGAARKYLDERKAESKPEPKPPTATKPAVVELVSKNDHHPVIADDSADEDQDTDGGGAPVSSGPLADLEPDPVGVSEDRIEWVIAQVNDLWLTYRLHFTMDAERFAFIAGLENWQARTQ